MKKLMLGLALVAVFATPALADGNDHYPPTCVDCDTADTGGVSTFAGTSIDPVKVGVLLLVVGGASFIVARRRRV